MEITWFGGTCVRLRGREGSVATDAFRSVVGPTGRGLVADICTYSHADDAEPPRPGTRAARSGVAASSGLGIIRPTSLEPSFVLDAPGEYEVHGILVAGVRTYRDDARGAERGPNTAFVFELDGLHAAHLGDVGHLLSEDMLGELGTVDVVCVPIGSALSAARTAELVAQLDARLIVPLPVSDDGEKSARDLERFLQEMSASHPVPIARLSVSPSTLPEETTVVLLESRGKPQA